MPQERFLVWCISLFLLSLSLSLSLSLLTRVCNIHLNSVVPRLHICYPAKFLIYRYRKSLNFRLNICLGAGRSRRDRSIEHTWNDSLLSFIQAPIHAFLHSSLATKRHRMCYSEYTIDDICRGHGSLVLSELLSEVGSGSMVLEDANTDSRKIFYSSPSYQRSKPKPDRHSFASLSSHSFFFLLLRLSSCCGIHQCCLCFFDLISYVIFMI